MVRKRSWQESQQHSVSYWKKRLVVTRTRIRRDIYSSEDFFLTYQRRSKSGDWREPREYRTWARKVTPCSQELDKKRSGTLACVLCVGYEPASSLDAHILWLYSHIHTGTKTLTYTTNMSYDHILHSWLSLSYKLHRTLKVFQVHLPLSSKTWLHTIQNHAIDHDTGNKYPHHTLDTPPSFLACFNLWLTLYILV